MSAVYCKTYTCDLAGNRTGFTLEKGNEIVHNIVYTYDNLNRLSTVKKNGTVEATYTYDTNGNRASLTYANGVVTTYSYNLANWITNLSNKNSDGETLSSYSYTYYTSGNQASKTDNTGKVTSYIYDDLGRLKQESESTGTTMQYYYDASGNRIQMYLNGIGSYRIVYTYDSANRLIKEAKTIDGVLTITEYTYDANGNTLTITSPDSLQVNTYNLFNKLVSTNINGNCSAYAYNTAGMRTAKSVNGVCTVFLLDGGNVVGEVESGEVTAIYLRGANLISRETDTAEQYYIFNAHGDVTGLVNNSQTVEKTYDYDAFGNEKNPSASDQNPFRYCGEYFDKETGTYYLRARYYDPSIGRFTQQDTHWNTANMIYGDSPNKINEREDALGLKAYTYTPSIGSIMQSGNLYVYCVNNPIKYADSTGNFFNTITGAIFGGIAGAITAISNGYTGENDIFWELVAINAVVGAASGLAVDLAVASGGVLAFAGAAFAGGVINIIGDVQTAKLTGETLSSDDLIFSFMVGSLSNAMSFGLSNGKFAERGGNIIRNLFDDTTKTVYSDTVIRVPMSGTAGKTKALQEVVDLVAPAGKGVAVYVKNLDAVVMKNVSNEFGMAALTSAVTYIYSNYY